MIFIFGGLCNDKCYFNFFTNKLKNLSYELILLNHSKFIEFEDFCNQSLLTYFQKKTSSNFLFGFSTGCNVILNILPKLKNENIKVYLVNPPNLFIDFYFDKNVLSNALIPKYNTLNNFFFYKKLIYKFINIFPLFKKVFLFLYYFLIGRKNYEPFSLLKYMSNTEINLIQNYVIEYIIKVNTYKLIKKIPKNMKQITIITGNKDKFNEYSNLLHDQFNDFFSLYSIEGMHHLFYFQSHHIIKKFLYY